MADEIRLGRTTLRDADREIARLRARVAELEAENTAVDQGRPEALVDLLCAVAAVLPEETPEERADWADRQWRRAYRVAVRATRRVDELRARADAAEKRVDELLWIESTSCCGDQANQYGVRARNAEAQVQQLRDLAKRCREAIAHAGYARTRDETYNRIYPAALDITRTLETLDAADTPAEEPDSAAGWTPVKGLNLETPWHQGWPCPSCGHAAGQHRSEVEGGCAACGCNHPLWHPEWDPAPAELASKPPVPLQVQAAGATPLATSGPAAVTDAMVRAATTAAEQAGGFAHDTDRRERETLVRAALEAALASTPPPHTGQACPNRIEVTGWGMTERAWICGCDPRPDAS